MKHTVELRQQNMVEKEQVHRPKRIDQETLRQKVELIQFIQASLIKLVHFPQLEASHLQAFIALMQVQILMEVACTFFNGVFKMTELTLLGYLYFQALLVNFSAFAGNSADLFFKVISTEQALVGVRWFTKLGFIIFYHYVIIIRSRKYLILCTYFYYKQIKKMDKSIQEMAKDLLDIISDNSVYLSLPEWENLQIEKHIGRIKQWFSQSINMSKINKPLFCKTVEEISFPRLAFLSLRKNDIQTVQNVYRLRMPCLQTIWIDDNNICSIREFRKINSSMVNIYLSNNPIKDCENLVNLRTQQLRGFNGEYPQDPQLMSDLRWIMKLQTKKLYNFEMGSKVRIKKQIPFKKKYLEL